MYTFSIYSFAGWLLAGIGLSLILIGAFEKRIVIHKLPHCPNCGYPLTDVPKIDNQTTCPECGRIPQSPTDAYTMGRKKRVIVLGIALFTIALILPQIPTVQSKGWRSTLPMSIQISMWDTADSKTRDRIQYAYRNGQLSSSKTDQLRQIIQNALANKNTPKPLLSEAIAYINLSLNFNLTKANPLLTDADIASALSNSSIKTQRLIMSYIQRMGVPTSPELRQARRQLMTNPDHSLSRDAIGWILAYPSDDPEDAQTVRSFFTESDNPSFWNFQNQFDRADPQLLQIPVSLLQHEDPKIRDRAIQCLSYVFSRTDTELSLEDSVKILDLMNDPDESIQYHAMRLLEELPLSAEPLIDQLLRNETDPEKLDSLIHSTRRRNPDAIGLAPAMASISENRTLPLRTRLDAADVYDRIRYRADDQPQIMYPVYDDLVDALIDNNFPAAFTYGQEIRSYLNPWALTAITRRMLDEGVKQNQINNWFTDRPGIAALLDFQHPSGTTPQDQLQAAIIKLSKSKRPRDTAEIFKSEIKRALDTFYPDHINSDPAP